MASRHSGTTQERVHRRAERPEVAGKIRVSRCLVRIGRGVAVGNKWKKYDGEGEKNCDGDDEKMDGSERRVGHR